jgi:micrococcal nuclease
VPVRKSDEKKSLLHISLILAAIFLIAIGIACIDIPPSGVIIYAFDQNPAGLDEGNEWVAIHNPTNKSVHIGNWTLETTNGSTVSVWIAEGTALYPGAYITFSPSYRWIDNNNESIILKDAKGEVVDRTSIVNDNESDNRYWLQNDSEWTFGVRELEKGKLWSGYVKNVVDGDTVDIHFNICGVQRVRLVGINTPEIGEEGYEEAKEFLNETCMWKEVKLDVDDEKQYDSYYRILAVVYVNETNINEKMVREGYAEVMYIPPSEFDCQRWVRRFNSKRSTQQIQFYLHCISSQDSLLQNYRMLFIAIEAVFFGLAYVLDQNGSQELLKIPAIVGIILCFVWIFVCTHRGCMIDRLKKELKQLEKFERMVCFILRKSK